MVLLEKRKEQIRVLRNKKKITVREVQQEMFQKEEPSTNKNIK